MTPRLYLKPRRARPLFGHHPWVFERAIGRIEGEPKAGDAVELRTDRGEFVAHGLFNPNSAIRVRLYSWRQEKPINEEMIARRVHDAIRFRRQTLGLGKSHAACRLIYSESDGLSGVIADRFSDVVTLQINSLAVSRFEPTIVNSIQEILQPRTIYRRVDAAIAELERLTLSEELLAGELPSGPTVIEESGVEFVTDPIHGQKTGAYLDQRDNRLAVARYASGRSMLDVFCYAGGFGLVAGRHGATSVTCVDASADAISLARQNGMRNNIPLELRQGDAAGVMSDLTRSGRTFGVVSCDPPKFAAKGADLEGAMRGYEYINRLAIGLVEPGGILSTCSCSGLVTPQAFLEMLTIASQKSERELRVLEVRGQSPDHPVSLYCPETAYLKCVIARVM